MPEAIGGGSRDRIHGLPMDGGEACNEGSWRQNERQWLLPRRSTVAWIDRGYRRRHPPFVRRNPTVVARIGLHVPSVAHPLHWSLLPVLLGGCGTYHYMPNSHNVPLFHERGEVRAMIGKSTPGTPGPKYLLQTMALMIVDEQPGFELQGAYALTDHLGLVLNGFSVHNGRSLNARYAEAGAGWFTELDDHVVVEAYATAGLGRIRQEVSRNGEGRIDLARACLQPALGYSSRNFDLAFSLRLTALVFHDYEGPALDDHGYDRRMAALAGQAPRAIVEPALTLRFGPRSARMQLQWGWANNLGRPLDMVDQTFSLGLQLSINNHFRRP